MNAMIICVLSFFQLILITINLKLQTQVQYICIILAILNLDIINHIYVLIFDLIILYCYSLGNALADVCIIYNYLNLYLHLMPHNITNILEYIY